MNFREDKKQRIPIRIEKMVLLGVEKGNNQIAIDEDRRKEIAEEFKKTVNDKNININWY